MIVIPVLLYHSISDSPSDLHGPTAVSPSAFYEHMEALANSNCRTMTVSQLTDQLASGTFESSAKGRFTVLVTFDDGFADFETDALPIMNEFGIESTLYLTTGFMGGGQNGNIVKPTDKMLSWSQVPEINEAGVEIGAHSHTHPQMDTLLPGRAWDELVRCKALLEDSIGTTVRSFAYPHGYNSSHLRYQTRLAGYDSAVAVRNAFSHSGENPSRIARLTVMNDTPFSIFRSWIAGHGAPVSSRLDHFTTRGWRTFRYTKARLTNQIGTVYK